MNYGEIKRFTLELIDRYSVAGETVSPAYNGQSDYIRRIPNLINSALAQIAPFEEPDRLPADPPDAYELSAPFAQVQCACYYAAALLVADENEFLYSALMNEFESFLNRVPRVRAHYAEMREAYPRMGEVL